MSLTIEEFAKVYAWMGRRREGDHHGDFWAKDVNCGTGKAPFWDWCKDIEEANLDDSEVTEALNLLVEKGIKWNMDASWGEGEGFELVLATDNGIIYSGYMPTIHEAIEQAILRLLERENI